MKLHEESALPVWRSLLFVPVNVPKFVAKAHTRGADGIILDLEDSIPPAEKANARTLIGEAAAEVGQGGADIVVRINRPLELAVRDIEAAVSPAITALMLTKIDSASHLRLLAEVVANREAAQDMSPGHTRFIVLVETTDAFSRIEEIARAHPRNVAMSLGSEDFAAELGGEPAPDVLAYPKQRTAIAANAAGILPLGVVGTVADYTNLDAYRDSVIMAKRFGFRGSACIHPAMVPILNEGFSPSAGELDWARRVVAVYEEAKAKGRASIELDGKMVDIPIVERAERLLAVSRRITEKSSRRT